MLTTLPDARFILYMCEDLIDKIHQRDKKLSEKNQEISFLKKELDMKAELDQERENRTSLLEKSCKRLGDENVLLKEEIQKLKMR